MFKLLSIYIGDLESLVVNLGTTTKLCHWNFVPTLIWGKFNWDSAVINRINKKVVSFMSYGEIRQYGSM